MPFFPDDFDPPRSLWRFDFTLEPLSPQHNKHDYDAWMSSIDHILATPGFSGHSWPQEMTLEENLLDIEGHVDDFQQRKGFTFTVLQDGVVIGCVYIYPNEAKDGVRVRSWVRKSHAHLDKPLYEAVSQWLSESWPFENVEYAPRA